MKGYIKGVPGPCAGTFWHVTVQLCTKDVLALHYRLQIT